MLSNENERERVKGIGSGESERAGKSSINIRVWSTMESNSLSLSLTRSLSHSVFLVHLGNCSLHATLICVIRFEACFTSFPPLIFFLGLPLLFPFLLPLHFLLFSLNFTPLPFLLIRSLSVSSLVFLSASFASFFLRFSTNSSFSFFPG